MTCVFFEQMGGNHEVTRVFTQYTFLGDDSGLAFLDSIAGSLVVVSISDLVFAATVPDNVAALTAGELGAGTTLVAQRTVRISGESHDRVSLELWS